MRRISGLAVIVLFCASLLIYQETFALQPVAAAEQDTEEEATQQGFSEPEEAVEYLIYQIQEKNLDAGLRVCAIDDIAGYFYMTSYLNLTREFPGIDLIPPSDNEDQAYMDIARIRLTGDFAEWFHQTYMSLIRKRDFQLLDIVRDEPENPDGKYYERKQKIVEILGARDVAEMTVYAKVNDKTMGLRLSLARYKKNWKVLLFNSLKDYKNEEPYLFELSDYDGEVKDWDFAKVKDVRLPKNYSVHESRTAKTQEEAISKFFLYLQRGDIPSAMAYCDILDYEEKEVTLFRLLKAERKMARKLQNFYYRTFLYQKKSLAWAARHYGDAPETIPEMLETENMLFVKRKKLELEQTKKGQEQYKLTYMSGNRKLVIHLTLEEQDDGWKIAKISQGGFKMDVEGT